jgi:formyltetrahydrofolate synthetase
VQTLQEPLSQYYKRFIQIKSQITNIPDEVVIIASIKGLRAGQCATHLTREKPTSLAQLYEEIQKYCKSNKDYRKRIEEENSFRNQNKKQQFSSPKAKQL